MEWIGHHQSAGCRILGAGIVVGSLVDPEGITNPHIRIHALEGRLFRGVVEDGAARRKLACSVWRERDLHGAAARALGRPERDLRGTVAALGRAMPGPWRAEQKLATLAAWLVLAGA